MDYLVVGIQSVTTVLVACIGLSWYSKERRRRKIERYEKLTEFLSSFYESSGYAPASSEDKKMKDKEEVYINRQEFINQYRLAFMYCPDEIIKKLNLFLDCLHTDTKAQSDIEAKKLVSELIIAIRNDVYNGFLNKSKILIEDFKHVSANL